MTPAGYVRSMTRVGCDTTYGARENTIKPLFRFTHRAKRGLLLILLFRDGEITTPLDLVSTPRMVRLIPGTVRFIRWERGSGPFDLNPS